MRTIFVSSEFLLNRRMRKAVARGKLHVVRADDPGRENNGGGTTEKAGGLGRSSESETRREIVRLIRAAASLARSIGVPNILQPGLVKEMMVADILGHNLVSSKRDEDACDPDNPDVKYEYLTCVEGGTGQMDRMFKSPPEKRRQSLERITRNAKIFLAVFDKNAQTTVKRIYELEVPAVLEKAERQLDKSRNDISHVSWSEKWARENGKIVYPKS